MEWQAIAVDLDGTLLGTDERVSPRNFEALEAARRAGLAIIIVTARWYHLAARIAEEVGAIDPIVACCGAQVRRVRESKDVLDLRLPEAFTAELYEILDKRRCIASIAVEEDVLLKMDGDPDPALLSPELRPVPSLARAGEGPARIALVQGSGAIAEVEDVLKPRWNGEVRFLDSYSSLGRRILTLIAGGASKGSALRIACESAGIPPSAVVAFGDSEADIEMFQAAGLSYAMGQAHDAVKRAASRTTAGYTDDGVALGIEQLLSGA